MKNFLASASRPVRFWKTVLLLTSVAGWLSAASQFVHGADPSPAPLAHYNLSPDRLALAGYDPVSYFTGQPLRGTREWTAQHRGVTYRFASLENRQKFTARPEKFLPAYGGWCATAMAKGEKVEVDPLNFKITEGRLFLFFKAFYANALKEWNKDEAHLTTKADAHWKRIAGE